MSNLVRREGISEISSDVGFAEITQIADVFVKSGFFTDIKSTAQAIVKIMAGSELGFGAMASMRDVHVIQGKTAIGANLVAAAIKRSGKYNYRFVQNDDKACILDFYENGEKIGTSSFTLEDARKAGLAEKEMWKKFARNLLFARAVTNGARWYTPDIFLGPIYTPDELGAAVDGETGELISVPQTVTQQQKSTNSAPKKWADMDPAEQVVETRRIIESRQKELAGIGLKVANPPSFADDDLKGMQEYATSLKGAIAAAKNPATVVAPEPVADDTADVPDDDAAR